VGLRVWVHGPCGSGVLVMYGSGRVVVLSVPVSTLDVLFVDTG
jgi:hypothetical protein